MTISSAGSVVSVSIQDKDVRRRLRRALRPPAIDVVLALIPMVASAGTAAGLAWLGGPLLVALLGATTGSGLPRLPRLPTPDSRVAHLVSDPASIERLIIGLCVLAAVRGLAQFAQAAVTERLQQTAMARIRAELFSRLLGAKRTAFVGLSSNEIAARVAGDVTRIDALVGGGAIASAGHGLTLAVLAVFAFTIDPALAALALATLPPVAIAGVVLSKRARKATEEALRTHASLGARIGETADAVPAIQTFQVATWAYERLLHAAGGVTRKMMSAARARAMLAPIMGFIASLAFAAILFVARDRLAHHSLTTTQCGSLFAALLLMLRPMTALGTVAATLATGFAAFDRLVDLSRRLPSTGATRNGHGRHAPPVFESLELTKVAVTHGEKRTLTEVSIRLNRGEVVAIVGKNGTGKTSLLDVILGHADAESGNLAINGKSYAEWGEDAARSFFAWVPEDAMLFAETVRDNITLGEPVDEARLDKAVAQAELDTWLSAQPQGLDTRLEHTGRELSAGERQRIAIARALYSQAPVLVLDEPTAHVDGEAAGELARTIRDLLATRTVLLVSHRLDTVGGADRTYVLAGGRVAEEGPTRELLRRGGPFSEMFGGEP